MNRVFRLLAALCLGCLAAIANCGANEPVVNYTSFLNMRMYPTGGVMFETVDLVFAPGQPVESSVEVQRDDGTPLARFPFFPEYRFRDKAFGRLQVSGPALWQADAAGRYQFVFRLGDKVITRFPFTVTAEPVISYYDATAGALKLARCTTATCEPDSVAVSTVDAPVDADVGQYASMVIGTNGLPIISYYDATHGDLKVVRCGRAACN